MNSSLNYLKSVYFLSMNQVYIYIAYFSIYKIQLCVFVIK